MAHGSGEREEFPAIFRKLKAQGTAAAGTKRQVNGGHADDDVGGKDRGRIRVSGPAYSDGPRRGRPGRDGVKRVEVSRHEVGLRSLGQPNALARQFDFSDDSYEWRRLF